MTWKPAGLTVALVVCLTAPTWAAPPKISSVSPLGVRRDSATEVTINGGDLGGNPQLIAPFKFTLGTPPAAKSDASNWRFNLVADPGTAVGVYVIRVKTDDGISNPFLFAVGQLAQVAEKEDNSTFETAQQVPSPVVVEGQSAGNDVDFFRFHGKKGERIVIDAQCARVGSGVDPTIRLTTARRTYVASADDTPGLLTDARLTAVLPEDTDYVVELSDSRYQGGGRPVYRLVIGALPMAEEVFPIGGRQGETVGLELRGGTLSGVRTSAATVNAAPDSEVYHVRATTQTLGLAKPSEPVFDVESIVPLAVSVLPELRESSDPAAAPTRAAVPVVLNGRIDPAGDDDSFVLGVTAGQRLRIEVDASDLGSALDGVLQVLDPKGAVLATADDTTIPPTGKKGKAAGIVSPDPSLDFTVPAGLTAVTLKLRDLEGRGGVGFPYRITVTPLTPTFELALNDAEVSIPKGGTAAVGVTVVRKGYNGPITLTVAEPPPGLSVRPGTIAGGQTVGAFTLSASADSKFSAVNLKVVGQGQEAGESFVREAEKHVVFAQQATLPTNTVTQHGLAAAPALPPALTLDVAATPIEVAHGYGTTVPLKVVRTQGADTALAITPLPLPPGLAIPAANIAAKASNVVTPPGADMYTGLNRHGVTAGNCTSCHNQHTLEVKVETGRTLDRVKVHHKVATALNEGDEE